LLKEKSGKDSLVKLNRNSLAFLAVLLYAASWWWGPHHSADPLAPQLAYVGPGAGFAFLGSFLTLLAGLLLSLLSVLTWPFRLVWQLARRRQGFKHARIRKLIFLGLDGLDPRLTERFLAEGKLPNLAKLRESGGYSRLRTTFPSLSPVAWSTFATGVNPAKHNIFDFLNRNLKSYVPELSSAHVGKPRRVLKLGKLRIPLSRPPVELRRKSQPFWKLLGEHNIGSTILRVPITFPPEKFNGRLLSAMCTPDLRGTQGSFSYFSTKIEQANYEGGSRYPLKRSGNSLTGSIEGPENSIVAGAEAMQIPFTIEITGKDSAILHLPGEDHKLKLGEYTDWITLKFKATFGIKVTGIARFMITAFEPEFSLYLTPIQINPEEPALPISHPAFYAVYLAKLLGTYSTLGMAEDTWALNEGVIDEDAFLKQAYDTMHERERMFESALEKTRRGVVACVFDTSDRVQHMFYRFLEGRGAPELTGKYLKTIEDLYQRMDGLVGKAMKHVDEHTVIFVLSDHGFCSFRRGINLNTWLLENGYLALKDGASTSGPYFRDVDWSRTKAYTFGLGGLYLNLKGREAEGTVPRGEAEALKQELIEKLSGLRDPDTGEVGIRSVYATNALYQGPYLAEAPDMIVGYSEGYRTSWDAAVGKVVAKVFDDNSKAWSGDHCVDPVLVPGVLFSNRKLSAENPGIEDLAPTAMELFGLKPPAWMEGKPVFDLT
jgi:predicted AlkP superfamily phosphohydrolase/phosphomutase